MFAKMSNMQIGIIGSGSWATAIAKIITDNGHEINWWVRQSENIAYFKKRHHNPHYLRNAFFDTTKINFSDDIAEVVKQSSVIIMAVPSIHIESVLEGMQPEQLKNKKIVLIKYNDKGKLKNFVFQTPTLLNLAKPTFGTTLISSMVIF